MSSKNHTRSALRMPEGKAVEPETIEPCWVGWVYALDGVDGYRRRKVRIPISMLEHVAIGESSAPDLRGTVVMGATADAMTDAFLHEMTRAKRGEL